MSRKPTRNELEQRVKDLEKEVGECKRLEKALSSSHTRLRAVFEAIQGNINVVDVDFNLIDVNEVLIK